MKEQKKIPSNWWELLEKVEHNWVDTKVVHYGKVVKNSKLCTVCKAEDYGYGPQFSSCRVMTDYPGDDSPCLCTQRQYLEAHDLI